MSIKIGCVKQILSNKTRENVKNPLSVSAMYSNEISFYQYF